MIKIEPGRRVEVLYILRTGSAEGEIAEQTSKEEPLAFSFREDPMLPAFENALEGLSAGDKFTVAIPCADAYGEENDEHFIEFPKSEFVGDDGEWDDELFGVGEVIPMNTPDGQVLYGVVSEVKLNSIVIDFNHPMAGEDLFFEGEVLSVE
jgi:FKBP-type peptidyl-prolyl cis-trans isomerase SlyD